MMEFLNMGGYASYIWSAYGISALVLTGILVTSLRSYKAASKMVWALEEDKHVYQKGSSAAKTSTPESISAT